MRDDGGSRAGVGPPIPHPKLPLYLSLDDSLNRTDLVSHSRGQSYSIVAVGVPSGIEIEEKQRVSAISFFGSGSGQVQPLPESVRRRFTHASSHFVNCVNRTVSTATG